MANVNPGPAVNGIANSYAVVTPSNNGPSAGQPYQGANSLRLLASWRGVPVSSTGDIATTGVINASSYCCVTVVTSNALVNGVSGTIASANVGIFTAPAGGGSALLANTPLTGQTTNGFVYVRAASIINASQTAQQLYFRVGTAVAGGTCDVFLLGYDIS